MDEKHEKELRDHQRKIEKALASLTNKGIVVHLEPMKIIVFGVSRLGDEETALAEIGGEEIEKLYGEL